MEGVTIMSTLPIELLTEIFLLLPAKTLLRLKVVCKLWFRLITDLYFVNLHLQRSLATKTNLHFVVNTRKLLHLSDFDTIENILELDYPFNDRGVDVFGTVNGLVCFCEHRKCQVIIYNPTTQTNRLLPLLPIEKPLADGYFNMGFGFDTVSQDYKCVWIRQNYLNNSNPCCQVMIYSFNHHSWRRGPDVPHFFRNDYNSTALLHETIHWVGARYCVPRPIVAFSLQDENFSALTLPEFDVDRCLNVTVLDGRLCLLVNYLHDCDVWIMEEYGVARSWKKLFNVKHESEVWLHRIVSYSSSGKGLFVITDRAVAYLDLQTMETTNVNVPDFISFYDDENFIKLRFNDAHLCVENLLMLDQG